jgi:protein TonB
MRVEGGKKKRAFLLGWTASLLAHALILAVPVSLAVKARYPELEFFVQPEPSLEQKKEVRVKPPVRIPPSPSPKVRTQPEPEKEKGPPPPVIEPTAVQESPVVLSGPAPPAPPLRQEGPVGVAAEPAPSAKPQGPVETTFGEGEGPRFLHREDPEYPALARRWGKEGKVVLRLHLSEKGELLQVEVVTGQGFGLTEAAVQAVKKSTFLPARIKGKPVACKALLPIVFILRRE